MALQGKQLECDNNGAGEPGGEGRLLRRRFLAGLSGLGLSALLPGCASDLRGPEMTAAQIERNKGVALRFKKLQGTKDEHLIEKEVLAPGYRRLRGGMLNLANNARDQGFPRTGSYLRAAFPDRVDVIEEVIGEGDTVGLLFRLTGTHRGNLFGIPPTGRKVDVYEAAILRIAEGRVIEGWFMADEAGMLKQLGATLPPRKDGKRIVPPITNEGETGDAWLARLQAKPAATEADRNKIVVAASKSSNPPKGYRAADYKQRRQGFQHLRDYGVANGVAKQTPTSALPDRRDLVDGFIAEGDTVWMKFKIVGTQKGPLYGHPATNQRIEIPEIGIARFVGGKWQDGWYFGDELGMMLQLNALHMLGAGKA
jgi:predicted ester cyclase